MTTFQTWLDASLAIMQNKLNLFSELKEEADLDKLIIQGYVLKREVDAFLDFLEKRKKFG